MYIYENNKTFKDLDIGDIIYYYDHCEIKCKFCKTTPIVKDGKLIFNTTGIKPIRIYVGDVECYNSDFCFVNSAWHFSNESAANKFLKNMKRLREIKIGKLQRKLDREIAIRNKYKFTKYDINAE